MRVTEIDMAGYDRSLATLEKVRQARLSAGPIPKGEELYYTLMVQLFREVRQAWDEGKPFFVYGMSVPNELFVGMGVPAVEYDMASGLMTSLLRAHDAVYGAAMKLGVKDDICSAQRTPVGMFAKGWFPKPSGIVYTNLDQCDNCAQVANIMGDLYETPTYFLNRPFAWWAERGVEMMVGEFEDAVQFLEEQTGRKMDWDRLKEAIGTSVEQVKLVREIHKLVMARPCPVKARAANFAHWIRWSFAGRREGLDYFRAFRDEAKALADQGKGAVPNERFRLMSIFTPPQNQMKMLDWLEHEKGVALVAEPYYFRYGPWDMDPSRPLESLARQYFHESYYRFYGQMEEYLDMVVQDALESGAQAALNWFNSKCRQGGSMAKVVKDTLADKVGIPVLNLDLDILDPSAAEQKRTKERIEGFLESLA
ncbi:MAG TPA: 2-hydroxyacyl-CoA dehydratase family protein [Dehalococcoidia bacterium]|nr:2-hydroxyacyl-CoA dehydratase family protein [Dehalococcoidia bacterium]